jgi:protein required for attachment to host cells
MTSQNQKTPIHWVLVANGQTAQVYLYSNAAHEVTPVPDMTFSSEHPADFEIGSPKPGAAHESVITGWQGNMQRRQAHEKIMDRFVKKLSEKFDQIKKTNLSFDALTLVAPSRMVNEFKTQLPANVWKCVVALVQKDLTQSSPHDLVKHLKNFEMKFREKRA